MKKIVARTLEDAYMKAAFELECSVTELRYEIIQHPSNGILGFMRKSAIIVAECTQREIKVPKASSSEKESKKESNKPHSSITKQPKESSTSPLKENIKETNTINEELIRNDNTVLDNFFDDNSTSHEGIINEFEISDEEDDITIQELEVTIQKEIERLFAFSCYDIDTIEVTIDNSTAEVYLDGMDAALIIGKEGHRYNALSYMLFNWLQSKYNLYVKLEIAQFLSSQKEMIKNYIAPVIDHVYQNGRGKTKPLDGILVQLALEELRAEFKNKYVAVKTTRDGQKYIVINDFTSKH
ncbi:MAG: Jag N-terminal domain-containing protein [Campylobacterales bacterium]|nr:Jag N-terminal domain-containing protein [Campylobacterales bacterium]